MSILAIKIVTVDFYNTFPIEGLDATRSDFRGSQVKTVPVIRIYGITTDKRKICCNVHNVFPHFFCPCPESDLHKVDDMMNQLAEQLDLQINTSLGQSTSTTQHIYRVSLCKGTPYYGYHPGEHQFFRIEFYNPNLLKRAANILQGGNVLGRMLQPHESHLPYIIKFFIDYNLFGMSYLCVPIQKVHTRVSDDTSRHKKRSVSQLEVDFSAEFILNRRVLFEMDPNKAANVGIETIWEDERTRRSELNCDVAELKTQAEEIRNCQSTESDLFFKRSLKNALDNIAHFSASETLLSENTLVQEPPMKRKFNLNTYLDASSYAVELSQSSGSSKEENLNYPSTSHEASQTIEELEKYFLETNPECDLKTSNEGDENNFENDSLLAPFSQIDSSDKKLCYPTQDELQHESDSEDEFNMTLADLETAICARDDEENFPQFDGAVDDIEIKKEPDDDYLQAGPSGISYKKEQTNFHSIQNNLKNIASFFDKEIKSESDSDDENMKSFYNHTLVDLDWDSNESVKMEERGKENTCIITPAIEPPDPENVFDGLLKYNLPTTLNKTLFYGNPADITEKKEVGHNILEIPGNKLNDCEDFKSLIFDTSPLVDYQNNKASQQLGIMCTNSRDRYKFIVSHEEITIHPIEDPPSYEDAKNWLISKIGNFEAPVNTELESPVKMKREKTLMVLELDENEQDVNFDKTLVPETPKAVSGDIIYSSIEKETPSLNSFVEEGLYLSYSARKKRKRKMKQSFSKKFQEIMKAKVSGRDTPVDSPYSSSNETLVSDSSEDFLLKKSQSSEESKVSQENTDVSTIIENANNVTLSDSIEGSSCGSLNNTYGFKVKLESLKSSEEHNDLTILSMELHVQSRNDFKPNPETDEIAAVFYSLEGLYVNQQATSMSGIIAVTKLNLGYLKHNVEIIKVKNELELFDEFFKKIRLFDPDIFAGYEIELASWGYLIERAFVLNMNLCNALSRMPWDKEPKKPINKEDPIDHDQGDYYSEQRIPGRILLDVWRLMRHEIALTSYTFENISYHILHRRYPKHSYNFLTTMWNQPLKMWIVLDYYMTRSMVLLEILKQLDLIGRTCELAKLFGIQFFEVLSRGSQFRVESMMLRIAKRRNYVAVSPSVQQRLHQRAPEYIPLVMEPESRFYTDPVIVLDFQSLYPSMIIAYNYCFSTCLGRIEHLVKGSSQPFEFGAYQLKVSPARLKSLLEKDLITVSPCGVAFVKSCVREGVLPKMLKEILDTRFMVKKSMKLYKNDSALQRVLHSRQLGLKLIANVTYGYTAANFSGRMPAIEVGDSVVSKGRETLERAIKMVESNEKWKCRVCYGDTDSLFVLVPGRNREDAFKIGEEIVEAVTKENPYPVLLKLEKVYQPCILQTKKRYVGNMYETPDQTEPVFEAKGIETIRRDGCPATQKILEKSLKILFDTYDVSKVKEYVCRQFTKILEGKCNIQDLIIAKEFRGISGYKEKAVVPALTLTRKWKSKDVRNEPRRGERVPFLLTNGPPNSTLIKLVKSPLEVLNNEGHSINSTYYITKAIIPPLNRCLLLIGANAHDWFAELPKKHQALSVMTANQEHMTTTTKKTTIAQFFNSTNCATCDNYTDKEICDNCRKHSQKAALILTSKISEIERKFIAAKTICEMCCNRNFENDCISLDCPNLYSLTQIKSEYKRTTHYHNILGELF